MPDSLDLTGSVAEALNGAITRGRPPAVGYIGANGAPELAFRGSTHVHGPQQLAIWARKQDSGMAAAIAANPAVSVLYFSPDGPGPALLRIKGRARVDAAANDAVYAAIPQGERDQDPDRNGVAVIVDVDYVWGFGGDGMFEMAR